MFSFYANPSRFLRAGHSLFPWVLGAGTLFVLYGLFLGFFRSPADYVQGDSVRIMYLHVPSAWLGVGLYASMALAGVVHLVWKHTLAQCAIKPLAVVGACFTLVCLLTGSIWGKPTWGAWWVWDARLTSMLVLLFLYGGVLSFLSGARDPLRGSNGAALLAIVGVVNLPIIKWSVTWWNTLHQPASIMKLSSPSIHTSFLSPLLFMVFGLTCVAVAVIFLLIKKELLERRILVLSISRRVLLERLHEGKQ